ncbi:DUF551 domain-containing protein [Proteus sp. TSJ240517]|uniref:DUF551 domain-containing protein n=1 Tax=Proteus sp. TSJ240517 TaxID=3399622 RepID=UPI003A4D3B8B
MQGTNWVKVRDRLPVDRTQVILWDSVLGEVTAGHYSYKTGLFYNCGRTIENEITHWCIPPLPPMPEGE